MFFKIFSNQSSIISFSNILFMQSYIYDKTSFPLFPCLSLPLRPMSIPLRTQSLRIIKI